MKKIKKFVDVLLAALVSLPINLFLATLAACFQLLSPIELFFRWVLSRLFKIGPKINASQAIIFSLKSIFMSIVTIILFGIILPFISAYRNGLYFMIKSIPYYLKYNFSMYHPRDLAHFTFRHTAGQEINLLHVDARWSNYFTSLFLIKTYPFIDLAIHGINFPVSAPLAHTFQRDISLMVIAIHQYKKQRGNKRSILKEIEEHIRSHLKNASAEFLCMQAEQIPCNFQLSSHT